MKIPSYEEIVHWTIPAGLPTNSATTTLEHYGQIGDFFGGFWGTLIGMFTLVVVLITWLSTKRMDRRSKSYQIFAEILRTHEEIVSSMRIGKMTGRDAIGEILSEFYAVYKTLKEQRIEPNPPTQKQLIDAAFLVVYYGTHDSIGPTVMTAAPGIDFDRVCSVVSTLKTTTRTRELNTKLSKYFEIDKPTRRLWQQSVTRAFRLVESLQGTSGEKQELRDMIKITQAIPRKKIDVEEISKIIEPHSTSTEFGGHQNRLSQYLRNLHSAFTFLEDQGFSKKERRSLSKVIRSKLSNYEQALLAINAITKQGSPWIDSGLIDKYMPIKNIPKHFFSFDDNFNLTDYYPNVVFEWQTGKGKNTGTPPAK